MVGTFDPQGWAALVSALGVIILGVLQFMQNGHIKDVKRTSTDTNKQVTTKNGGGTLAEIAERVDERQKSDDAEAGVAPPPPAH